jgi:cell division protein FtsB
VFRLPTFGPVHMVFAVAVVLLGLFLYSMVQTAAHTYQLRQTERELYHEVVRLRAERAELEGLLAYTQSDEYIEAFARQQFGLVRPGEILVEVDAPPAPRDQQLRPGERWWHVLFGSRAHELRDELAEE